MAAAGVAVLTAFAFLLVYLYITLIFLTDGPLFKTF